MKKGRIAPLPYRTDLRIDRYVQTADFMSSSLSKVCDTPSTVTVMLPSELITIVVVVLIVICPPVNLPELLRVIGELVTN
jgi:hypothetical protein